MTSNTGPFSKFSEMLRRALGAKLDPSATSFVEMMAEDGVMEFPYALPGGVRKIEGRVALATYLDGISGLIGVDRMVDLVVHETANAETVILEFGAEGRIVAAGTPYRQRYISVITLRGGQIALYKDYWNPLNLLPPDAVASLAGSVSRE